MMTFLLKLIGVDRAGVTGLSDAQVRLNNLPFAGWALLLALGLGYLAWWTYRFRAEGRFNRKQRKTMTGLRIALFVFILLLMLRPVLSFNVEGTIRRKLLLLVDNSSSMAIQDPRRDPDDIKRAAMATGALSLRKGLAQNVPANSTNDIARVDLLRALMKNPEFNFLKKAGDAYDIAVFKFGKEIEEVGTLLQGDEAKLNWLDKLGTDSPVTPLGDSLRSILNRHRGQPVAGIFLVTDGASNFGSQPLDAARSASQSGVPLHIYGVGITSPRDIIVGNLFVQDVVFAGEEASATIRVRGQGLKGESGRLVVKLGDKPIAETMVGFDKDEEQTIPVTFIPEESGPVNLTASIEAREDEVESQNNSVTRPITVINEKIKVLYVEQSPRWEYRYLQAILMRDRRISPKFVLAEADPTILEAEDTPYLGQFPTDREVLFKADLVILGDVDPAFLPPEAIQLLDELVSKFGGALLAIGGAKYMPQAYTDSKLKDILPVEFAKFTAGEKVENTRPIKLQITPAGLANEMLALGATREENARVWDAFPPVYWAQSVERAKPAAQTLVEDSDPARATRFGKMPVIVSQQYGLGQVLYIGTDNLWRWRRNLGEDIYRTLYSQIIQKLALTHLLGGAKRTQLTVSEKSPTTGDRITVFARLYTPGFQPVAEPSANAFFDVTPPDGQQAGNKQSFELRALPGQPGMFRGEIVAVDPGRYVLGVEGDDETRINFNVTQPKYEAGETAMNAALLKDMAAASGGAFYREENLAQFEENLKKTIERVKNPVEVEIWSSPLAFTILMSLLIGEWILRKRTQLK
jgi:hypothetical protein